MSAKAMTVTVVLCTYNRAKQLATALVSLGKQTFPDGRAFEILVIDDGSTDNTPEVVQELAARSPVALRYVRVPHGGVATARNAGVLNAHGEWIAFFDDDQEAEPGWLSRLVGRAEEAEADCVAGRIKVVLLDSPWARPTPTVLKLLGDNGFMAAAADGSERTGIKVVPGTGNALARRSLFERFGLFDSSLTYGEDGEWFRRARRMGARIAFASDASVLHLIPPSRLTMEYLFSIAARGAASRAADDMKDGGIPAVLKVCALRIGHVALVAGPGAAAAWLMGDRDSALGRACSIRWSFAYLHEAAEVLAAYCSSHRAGASAPQ